MASHIDLTEPRFRVRLKISYFRMEYIPTVFQRLRLKLLLDAAAQVKAFL